MNCKVCNVAGDINALLVTQLTEESPFHNELSEVARKLHLLCKGPGQCTCQHRMGEWIDRSKIKFLDDIDGDLEEIEAIVEARNEGYGYGQATTESI